MAYASSDKQGSTTSGFSHAQEFDNIEDTKADVKITATATTPNEPLGRAIRNNYRLVAWCLAALTGLLLYGYDFVIVGNITSLRAFQRDYGHIFEGHLIIPSSWFALWKAASPLGTMIGAVIGGSFSDRFGRRASMAAGCIICAIGVGGCVGSAYTGSLAHRRGVFLGAKLFQGMGIGQTASAVQTYASEIVTPRLRGPIMSMVPLLTLIGQVIGAAVIAAQSGVATKYAYVTPMLSMLAFTIPPFLAAIFMPESPVWSVDKSKTLAAEKALIRLRGPNADTSDLLATIRASVMTKHRSQTTYMDCLKPAERRQTVLVMIAYTSPQFWGLTLLSNASYFLQVMGMGERASLLIVVLGILLGIVGNVGSLWTISSVGRRTLILSGLSVTTALWLGVGIANCFANKTTLW
jgi:MFS family permease